MHFVCIENCPMLIYLLIVDHLLCTALWYEWFIKKYKYKHFFACIYKIIYEFFDTIFLQCIYGWRCSINSLLGNFSEVLWLMYKMKNNHNNKFNFSLIQRVLAFGKSNCVSEWPVVPPRRHQSFVQWLLLRVQNFYSLLVVQEPIDLVCWHMCSRPKVLPKIQLQIWSKSLELSWKSPGIWNIKHSQTEAEPSSKVHWL